MSTTQNNQRGEEDPFAEQLPGGGMSILVWLIIGGAVLAAAAVIWETRSRNQVLAEAARVENELRRDLRSSFHALRQNRPEVVLEKDPAVGEKIAWLLRVKPNGYPYLVVSRLFIRAEARLMLEDRDGWRASVDDFNAGIALLRRIGGAAWEFGMQGRGEAYYMLGEYQLALEDFDSVVAVNPSFGAAYYWRSRTKTALGDEAGAAKDAAHARALDSWPPLRALTRDFTDDS